MKVLFVAGFGPIIKDQKESTKLYRDILVLPLKDDHGYISSENIEGVRHFSLWPLSHAAHDCFGTASWPKNISTPQAWMEFDVDNVENATNELVAKGYKVLVKAKKEPWGQTVTRLLSPEGILIGITYTPWMRKVK